ncbi:sarcosine oxidase subunit gamma [Pseudomaricurvus alkylphenolicus]|uniref:sarcosine oxidase subunit gamma n=1 Tax=Pseudomaricurvus alkylphenolicus TaxID=1306991 RepID=UPI00197F6C74|nr:sarcosine oxidase [Pseudomaricurvus alkylphenolicus]
MSAISPESFLKRSAVYRNLTGARFKEMAGSAIVAANNNGSDKATRSGLLDLSTLPRVGYRGGNAASFLETVDLPVPSKPNQFLQASGGELVLRLSPQEFWVLSALRDEGENIEALRRRQLPTSDCYSLYCQDSHAWLVMTGEHLPQTLAKVCGVDLSDEAFPVGAIAQTSVARINVIVVHHEVNNIPCFSLLCDSAAAEYLWDCLLDAMGEFGGEAVGIECLVQNLSGKN